MESLFGADFSAVRIHTDRDAALMARTLGAEAVTIGPHIAFEQDRFVPAGSHGRALLIHELAHAVQQKDVVGIPTGPIPITQPGDSSEREADAVSRSPTREGVRGLTRSLSSAAMPRLSRSVCGTIVEAACWAAFSAIAAAVAALCTVGSVVTVGGLAIPCTAVVITAAGAAAWDAVMCTHILQQEICGEPIAAAAPTPAPGGAGEAAAPSAAA